jgi:hypothetical protein
MATISATIHPPVVEPVPDRSIAVEFAAFAIAARRERRVASNALKWLCSIVFPFGIPLVAIHFVKLLAVL